VWSADRDDKHPEGGIAFFWSNPVCREIAPSPDEGTCEGTRSVMEFTFQTWGSDLMFRSTAFKSRPGSRRSAGLALAFVVAALGACGGYNVPDSTTTPPSGGAGVTGIAYLGPISGATASLFNVNPDGTNNGAAVEVVTTTATGFAFTHSITGPSRICVDGGTYVDEATATTQTNTVTLCALVGVATTQVFVTPMSGFVDAIVKTQLQLKTAPALADFTAALAAANTLIKTAYSVTATVDTIKPSFIAADATANPDNYKLGAVLGAYSQLIADYLARCGGDRHEVLKALLKDIGDNVFDGKTIDATGAIVTVQYTCNGATVNLPTGAGTADVIAAFGEFGVTPLGVTMDFVDNRAVVDAVKVGIVNTVAPANVKTTPSQGLIAIDTANNIGYVPIYTQDATGNGQVAVVNLDPASTSPIVKLISLPGTSTAIASNFFADTGRVYVLAANGSNLVVHVIKASDNTVEFSVPATGLSFSGQFGGVIVDGQRQHVVVAGTSAIGLLDISTTTPTWNQASIVNVPGTDSFSLNSANGLIFVSSDGSKVTIDSTVTPMVAVGYNDNMGTTDGVAFDTLTGMMIITPEFQDLAYVINMSEYVASSGTVPQHFTVNGTGTTTAPVGEGPGGQVAVNVLTHQALVADEFGQNLRLVQMPTTPITGMATATNAFTIGGTILPKPMISGTATQLGMRGDPNSVTIDPGRNYAYVLADTQPSYHGFNVNYPLFLIRIDLNGASVSTPWTPAMQTIAMP
jgi:hypothetical protein